MENRINERIPVVHWNYRNLDHIPAELKHYGKHVTDLYLKGNMISSLPIWISELQNLTEIFLYENRLNYLPESICQLKSLRILNIGRNAILNLPKSFVTLSQLSEFNADENRLECLPEGTLLFLILIPEMGKLNSLSVLYLNGNKLQKLPDSLSHCSNLRELSLDNNEIRVLPRFLVFLPNLSFFSACNNPLVILPVLPFQSQPIVRIGPTINAPHISTDWAEYFPQLVFQGATLRDNNRAVSIDYRSFIQDKIFNENDQIAPTLYELSLRRVYELYYPKRQPHVVTSSNNTILGTLPNTIRKELILGPTAVCRNCSQNIFKIAYIRFRYDYFQMTGYTITEYYCNPRCRSKATS